MDKKELIKGIDIDTRLIYIYSNVMVGDAVDGYITDLDRATRKAGMFRHGFKKAINGMVKAMKAYKMIMFETSMMKEETREQLVTTLDKLDDEFHKDIKILCLQIRQFLLDKVSSEHATLISYASTIEILSQYSLFNDRAMTQALSRLSGRRMTSIDDNIQLVNFYAREYVREFAKFYKDIEINLNECQAIFKAFEIIDKKTNKIPEFIYEDHENESEHNNKRSEV